MGERGPYNQNRVPRIMIAGASSGCGKTLLTCGLLTVFMQDGLRPAAYKCGPDYIDPMYHRMVPGVSSRNLDLFLAGEEGVKKSLTQWDNATELSPGGSDEGEPGIRVIEGVMGLYDGGGTDGTEGSSYRIAEVTGTPVILVVNARGMGRSVVPLIRGFQIYERKRDLIRGVLLNRVSPSIYPRMKAWIEEETGLPVVGGIPEMDSLRVDSRHLGLRQPHELQDLSDRFEEAARVLRENADVDKICEIAAEAPAIGGGDTAGGDTAGGRTGAEGTCAGSRGGGAAVRIAVARDEAFSFMYEDNLALLRELGAEIVWFSPLRDRTLPEAGGLILWGGYPELYAEQLSQNTEMLSAIRAAAQRQMPILAECGGFMYLQQSLTLRDGKKVPMAGVLPGDAAMTDHLVRFGYVTVTAPEGAGYLAPGESIRGHEFHYSDSTACGDACRAVKPDGRSWPAIAVQGSIWAGYPHLYYPSQPAFAERFAKACRAFAGK